MRFRLLEAKKIPHDGIITLYRVGDVDNFSDGLFFTDDLSYYDHSVTGYDKADAVAYKVDLSKAKVFDPIKELKLDPWSWNSIWGNVKEFDEYGVPYEYTDDQEDDEDTAITDTDSLAQAGKDLGYDITIIRDIPSDNGYGEPYSEYAIYNKDIVTKL